MEPNPTPKASPEMAVLIRADLISRLREAPPRLPDLQAAIVGNPYAEESRLFINFSLKRLALILEAAGAEDPDDFSLFRGKRMLDFGSGNPSYLADKRPYSTGKQRGLFETRDAYLCMIAGILGAEVYGLDFGPNPYAQEVSVNQIGRIDTAIPPRTLDPYFHITYDLFGLVKGEQSLPAGYFDYIGSHQVIPLPSMAQQVQDIAKPALKEGGVYSLDVTFYRKVQGSLVLVSGGEELHT